MNKTAHKILTIINVLVLSSLILSQSALAQEVNPPLATPSPAPASPSISKITAIPPHVNIDIEPGETVQESLKVKNDSDQELVLKITVKDFIVKDNEGTPLPIEEDLDNRWALAKWISVSPESFTIKPGETLPVAMTVQSPVNALPGGHYAMVTYEPSSEGMLNATGSKIAQKVGSLVNVVIAGDVHEDAQVIRFETDKKLVEYGPIDIATKIKNLSDVHISPNGYIGIYNMFNKKSGQLSLEKLNIFPLTSRSFNNTFEGKWRLGRYKAELKAGYGNQGNMLTALIYFWIIPWKLILLILLVITLLTTLVTYLKKQSKKKISQEVETKAQEKVKEILSKKEEKPLTPEQKT